MSRHASAEERRRWAREDAHGAMVVAARALVANSDALDANGRAAALAVVELLAGELAGHRSAFRLRSTTIARALQALVGGQPGKVNGALFRAIGEHVHDLATHPRGAETVHASLVNLDPAFRRLTQSDVKRVLAGYCAAKWDELRRRIDAVTALCVAARALGAPATASGDTRDDRTASAARRRFRSTVANALTQ